MPDGDSPSRYLVYAVASADVLRTPRNEDSRQGMPCRLFVCVEATPGIEPGIKALQASALPLGHVAMCGTEVPYQRRRLAIRVRYSEPSDQPSISAMERTTGFEPATPTLARLCSTN